MFIISRTRQTFLRPHNIVYPINSLQRLHNNQKYPLNHFCAWKFENKILWTYLNTTNKQYQTIRRLECNTCSATFTAGYNTFPLVCLANKRPSRYSIKYAHVPYPWICTLLRYCKYNLYEQASRRATSVNLMWIARSWFVYVCYIILWLRKPYLL